ncbi:MAG: NAD(P)-dependent oxidoreductase, partial [Bacillota bacterium]
GATKSFAEFLTAHYIRTWGVDAVGLRFALVYGPGRVRGASAFVNELLIRPALGQPAQVPFGDDVVDWQYVEDVATLIAKCLSIKRTKTPVFNTRFCIRSIREVGKYVQTLLPGARIDYEPGTFGIAWEADDSLLQEEVGFTPAYTVERGVLETINHVRRRHGLPPVVIPGPNVGLDAPGKGAISR